MSLKSLYNIKKDMVAMIVSRVSHSSLIHVPTKLTKDQLFSTVIVDQLSYSTISPPCHTSQLDNSNLGERRSKRSHDHPLSRVGY